MAGDATSRSETVDDRGPAFPTQRAGGFAAGNLVGGMTLRDYFAAQAMAGFAHTPSKNAPLHEYAEYAYAIADAMLAARAPAPPEREEKQNGR